MVPPITKKQKVSKSKESMESHHEQLLVVAEDESVLHSHEDFMDVRIKRDFSGFTWEWIYSERHAFFELKCIDFGEEEQINLELIVYINEVIDQEYSIFKQCQKVSKCLTKKDRNIKIDVPHDPDEQLENDGLLITLRILKPRSQFPNFDAPPIADLNEPIVKVRIQDRVFHVKRRILTKNSPNFDRMLNGHFNEANKDEITLEPIEPFLNAENFELYLLAISKHGYKFKMLPSRENVEILLQIADYFMNNTLKKICENHLLACREMPILKRIKLAKTHGLGKFQKKLTSEIEGMLNFNGINMDEINILTLTTEIEYLLKTAEEEYLLNLDIDKKKERKKKRTILKHCLALIKREYAKEEKEEEDDEEEKEESDEDEEESGED